MEETQREEGVTMSKLANIILVILFAIGLIAIGYWFAKKMELIDP